MGLSSTSIFQGIVKADQAIASNINLADITDFVFPIEANRSYIYEAHIQFALAGVVSGFKFGVANPVAPSNHSYNIRVFNSVGLSLVGFGVNAGTNGALASIASHYATILGSIENGANAGNLSIQAAQNVSDLGALTIKRGSILRVYTL